MIPVSMMICSCKLSREVYRPWYVVRHQLPSFEAFCSNKKSPVVTMRDEDELLRTPEDAKRKCTDVVCLVVFLAIMGGLGYCIHQSVEAGDIQRLQSLPDYQGTQCSFLWKFLETCWGTSFGLSAACITFEGVMTAKMHWNDRDA